MRVLDKLERKIGWFAIRNLTIYLVAGNALVWLIGFIFTGNTFVQLLVLYPGNVLRGEIWRALTFIFINSFGSSPLSALLELYFLYIIGRNLDAAWGSFRFTFFYFTGFALTVIVSLVTGFPVAGARYIHLSLFLSFARLAPDMRIYLFFIIPIKIKWLSWAAWAFLAFEFITARFWMSRLLIAAPLVAFALFFGGEIIRSIKYRFKKGFARSAGSGTRRYGRREASERRKTGLKVIKSSFHKCEVCGLTEHDDPDMEFRYCSSCEGNYEYCANHLGDHIHRSAR